MKNFLFIHRKPSHYYNKLISFLAILSFLLTFPLMGFKIELQNLDLFLAKFILLFLFLLFLSSLIEIKEKGEVLSSLEIYEIESFTREITEKIANGDKEILKYISKYNHSYNTLKNAIEKKKKFTISTIRKEKNRYTVGLIDERKWILFFIIRYFIKDPIHYVTFLKEENKLRIVYFK